MKITDQYSPLRLTHKNVSVSWREVNHSEYLNPLYVLLSCGNNTCASWTSSGLYSLERRTLTAQIIAPSSDTAPTTTSIGVWVHYSDYVASTTTSLYLHLVQVNKLTVLCRENMSEGKGRVPSFWAHSNHSRAHDRFMLLFWSGRVTEIVVISWKIT